MAVEVIQPSAIKGKSTVPMSIKLRRTGASLEAMSSGDLIVCEFEHVGCKEKVLHKEYDAHVEINTQKHLQLLSNAQHTVMEVVMHMEKRFTDLEEKTERKIHLLHVDSISITIASTESTPFYVLGYCMSVGCKEYREANSNGANVSMSLVLHRVNTCMMT